MLLATPRAVTSCEQLSRLWLHEASRVFGDRLTCADDRGWLGKLLVGATAG